MYKEKQKFKKESHLQCFIVTTDSELIPVLLDERVSVAPQQPLPVLSVSHFLPRSTVSGRLPTNQPSALLQHIPSCLLFPANYSTRAASERDTLAFSLDSALFLYQALVSSEGKRRVWAGSSLNHNKASIPHRGHCNWLMDKKLLTLSSQHPAVTQNKCATGT